MKFSKIIIHLELEDKVVQINDALEQIANLNQQILNMFKKKAGIINSKFTNK